MKLPPEAKRIGAQVLLCQEQTLPLEPWELCRGTDPCKLGGMGCTLLLPAGAQGMWLQVSVTVLESLASAEGGRVGASTVGYKETQPDLVQGICGCGEALEWASRGGARSPVQLSFLPVPFSSVHGQQTGLSPETPFLDPCMPVGLEETVVRGRQTLYVRGRGDWPACVELLQPLLAGPNSSQASLVGAYKAPIDFSNSEFYGFSEFFYCTEDVLRLGGRYSAPTFTSAAQEYCSQRWEVLTQRFRGGLYSAHADQHRLKYQCFKSAWMYQVLHQGFHFPLDYPSLRTAQLVYDREVQWTLGAILYKTRFLPLRDLRQESIRQAHASWLRLSFVYNHYLFFACILVVVLAIVLYLLRLRRIHRRQLRSAQLALLWLDKVVVPPGQGNGP